MTARGARNIRGSINFRHSSPLARLLSLIIVATVAMMLSLVGGTAFADGDGSRFGDAAAASPDGVSSSGATSSGATSSTSTKSGYTPRGSTAKAAAAAPAPKSIAAIISAAIVVQCLPGSATVVGGFEIDGDTCVETNLDWDSTGVSVEDGFDDNTGFTGGSSENDAPTSWVVGGTPNGKTDIGTAWAYSHVDNGTVYGYFALTNNSTSGGTSQYDLEYNQLDPTTNGAGFAVPNRSPGDLLFRFSSTGSDAIAFTDAKKYTLVSDAAWGNDCFEVGNLNAGWCTIPIPDNAFAQQVNADGTFFEGAINISLFFGDGTCSGNFGTTSIRSVTGNAFATSALKDYVTPLGVNTPSTCGGIVINKQDANGAPLGGATFSVSPNPDPNQANATPYSITDNDANDQNPANGVIEIRPVDPNESYTVTETSPPPGYLLPDQTSQGPTLVGPSQTVSFTFNDPKQWQALTAEKTAIPAYTATYAWSILKEISADGNEPWVTDSSLIDPLVKTVPADGNPTTSDLSYRVTVTDGARTTSDYSVHGTISVTNPNDAPVTAHVSDALPGTTCKVEGEDSITPTLDPGVTGFAYVCTFAGTPTADELSGTNTATVAWDKSAYPQVQADLNGVGDYTVDATQGYAFGDVETTSVNKTVTVTDDHHTFDPAWTLTWTGEGDTATSEVYTVPIEVAPGNCSAVAVNTAAVIGAGDVVLASDTAAGQLCAVSDLTISDTATGAFTRTYSWQIDKFIDTDQKSQQVQIDGLDHTFDYTVAATPLARVDSGWVISGTIGVDNPNSGNPLIDPITVTGVSELLDVGTLTDCVYDTALPVVLNGGDHLDVGFTCTVDPTPTNDGAEPPVYEGTHQANVTWDDLGTATSDSTNVGWQPPTEIDKSIAVYDNKVNDSAAPIKLGDAEWNADGTPTTFTYSLNLSVPADTAGSCAPEFDNLAWLGGDGVTPTDVQSGASAVICVNEVIVSPPEPPKNPLPPTGGPDFRLLMWGLALLGAGGALVLSTRKRRRS